MKIYICKKCGYRGTRHDVRKHLREEHLVRGLRRNATGKRVKSMLSAETNAKEWK